MFLFFTLTNSLLAIALFLLLTALFYRKVVLQTAASDFFLTYELLGALVYTDGYRAFSVEFVNRERYGESAARR